MAILRVNIGIKKFFHSLPIQGRYIKYVISLVISSMKFLLHLQDIYLEGMINNKHGNHPTHGDVHWSLPLWQHLVFVKDFNRIQFMLLDNLNYPIKKHVIHGLESSWNVWTLKKKKNQSLTNKVRIKIKWEEV